MQILTSILIVLALSVGIMYVCLHIRLPALVGYLFTGVLVGPHGLGLVYDIHIVEVLAEIGVILLLFSIGLEFSLSNLRLVQRQAFYGGTIQVLGTICVVFLVSFLFLVEEFGPALFLGFLVALSSTAIVLKLLQEKAAIESPHGRASLAILIFQDLIIVPMLLVLPLLGQTEGSNITQTLVRLLLGGGIVVVVLFSAWKIIPHLLYQIVKTRSRELFLVSIVVICFSVAWLTSSAGLSLALGAFLAGLIISESEYSHQALANILPFRDLFSSFFFISIGMLLNIHFVFQNLPLVAGITLAVLVLKFSILLIAGTALGYPLRTTVILALALSQVGEFSFVLAKAGQNFELITSTYYQIFLSFSVLTMMITPFAIGAAPRLADRFIRMPLPQRLKHGHVPEKQEAETPSVPVLKDHLIIIGYGHAGENLARAATNWSIPYLIIEMNPLTVRKEREKGLPIFFGDATHEAILESAKIHRARMAILVISDPTATRRITQLCRELNPSIYLMARTRFFHERQILSRLGANVVISEEFEAAIEIISQLLYHYYIPEKEIENFIQELRLHGYQALREQLRDIKSVCELDLPNVDIQRYVIEGDAPAEGKTLVELELRKKYGVTVLAVRRGSEVMSNPNPKVQLNKEDVLLVVGRTQDLHKASALFHHDQSSV